MASLVLSEAGWRPVAPFSCPAIFAGFFRTKAQDHARYAELLARASALASPCGLHPRRVGTRAIATWHPIHPQPRADLEARVGTRDVRSPRVADTRSDVENRFRATGKVRLKPNGIAGTPSCKTTLVQTITCLAVRGAAVLRGNAAWSRPAVREGRARKVRFPDRPGLVDRRSDDARLRRPPDRAERRSGRSSADWRSVEVRGALRPARRALHPRPVTR